MEDHQTTNKNTITNIYKFLNNNINDYSCIKKENDYIIINTNSQFIDTNIKDKINMNIDELIKDYNDKIDVLNEEFFRILKKHMHFYYLKDSLIFLKYNNEILKNENKEYIISLIDDYEEQLYKIYNYEKYLDELKTKSYSIKEGLKKIEIMNKKLKDLFDELIELLEIKDDKIHIIDKMAVDKIATEDVIYNRPHLINSKIHGLKITKDNEIYFISYRGPNIYTWFANDN